MKYIKLFENSDLRDAYENGSDYIEPYVSYTSVINEYEAQFNGRTIDDFAVTKQGNSYLISSNSNSIEIINEEEFGEKPIVNSNIFYISRLSTGLDVIRSTHTAYIYVFPEDLELTEESTEFTFNGVTYAIESSSTNAWSVIGRNPDEGLHFSNIAKFDIVSVQLPNTDAVHYNKKILPENRELWEKFNLIYGDNITSEDLRLFSTYPMTYEVYNDLNSDNTYGHWIKINTDIKACYNYNTPNPDYRGLVDLNNQYGANLYFQDSNDTATIDDFTGMGTTNHEWVGASCVK